VKVIFFLRELNSGHYEQLPSEVNVLPRIGETINIGGDDQRKYYQVIGVNHALAHGSLEIYCVLTEPSWEVKESGNIGFSFR
jgi:hypothetical protein